MVRGKVTVYMSDPKFRIPKVQKSFRIGNRGEAYLEFIMSKHCLMHKIAGYKDVGIDYLCEWLVEDSPTRILFGVQVKTSDINNVGLKRLGRNKGLNGLEKFAFTKTVPSWDVKTKTVNYWFGFEIPLYLFFVLKNKSSFDCYYQRLTPSLHKKDKTEAVEEIRNYKSNDLYQVNDGNEFRAIIKRGKKDGGFARDLFFDSVRCSYYTGSLNYRDSSEFGLEGWEGKSAYVDILGEERCPYMDMVEVSLANLEGLGIISVIPGWKDRVRDLKRKLRRKN